MPIANSQDHVGLGSKGDDKHGILGFKHLKKPDEYLVVDMTRLQYSDTGRGDYGENYFLGTLSDWKKSMGRICERLIPLSRSPLPMPMGEDRANEARLKACAYRAWQRWNDRGTAAWCDFCGKGGPGLKQCGGCKTVRIPSGHASKMSRRCRLSDACNFVAIIQTSTNPWFR